MTEPTTPADASRHMAERRAGVYDDDTERCHVCDARILPGPNPCICP